MTHELYKTEEEIENWLNQYEVKNYELVPNKEYGYIVNVNKTVILNNKNLKEIKVKINMINGGLDCSNNQLSSLYGCPEIIKGLFDCSYNQLKNLKYIPKIIDSNMWVNNNCLNTLEFIPKIVKGQCFLDSNLELKHVPDIVKFEDLYLIHKKEINNRLNEKLDKEISIENIIKLNNTKI